MSQCRQLFHEECEVGLNKQINLELFTSYTYLSMVAYFDRDDVALPGFKTFCQDSSIRDTVHANKLIAYQNKRGGRVVFQPISKPAADDWASPIKAMERVLELEKQVNKSLLDLHKIAMKHEDADMMEYLEKKFLKPQVKIIKRISDYITDLKRVGPGMGEYLIDMSLLDVSREVMKKPQMSTKLLGKPLKPEMEITKQMTNMKSVRPDMF